MPRTLDQFAAECHHILAADPGAGGRERLCSLVGEMTSDEAFIAAHFTGASERDILYEDSALGFCILAHADATSRQSTPHDHGPTWAIYGQVTGETIMTEWTVVSPRRGETPGKVRPVRKYSLKPGDAHLYNEGDIHSPSRIGANSLLRIEGRNIKELPYEWFEAELINHAGTCARTGSTGAFTEGKVTRWLKTPSLLRIQAPKRQALQP